MAFEETLQDVLDSIKRRDLDHILSIISIDKDVCQIIMNGSAFKGRAAFIQLQKVWFSDPDWKADFKVLRTIETPEMGYALISVEYSDANLTDSPYTHDHYLSLVFIRDKEQDRWSLVHDQTTKIE